MSNRKLNGRPPLKAGKREFRITARFNEEEYRTVQELEKTLGVNKTDIVRSRLLENGTTVMVNAREVIGELDRIGTELSRSGNNINQVAHYANVLKLKSVFSETIITDFMEVFERHLEQRKELDTSIRKLIRILGH